jgi:uncharacterized protein (TIGR02271 family)
MDTSGEQYQFRQGDEVYAAGGEKIGKLSGVSGQYLLIEKGWLFSTEYQIPTSAVQGYNADEGVIYLSVPRDEALTSGWDTIEGGDLPLTADDGGYDTSMSGGVAAGSTTLADGSDHLTVPLHEEELKATTRMREAGEVQIDKRVVAEEQTLEVPVTEERARVTRRTVDRDVTTGEDVFTEETIDVPLRAEEVELQKRTRVAEEIEIDKEQVQRTERVSGTVRKEVVDIDEGAVAEPEWDSDQRS